MSSKNKVNFGEFLSNLMQKNQVVANGALEALQRKMEEQKAQELENKLMRVAQQMQIQVNTLRQLRKQEKNVKARMAELEEAANKLVAGEEVEGY